MDADGAEYPRQLLLIGFDGNDLAAHLPEFLFRDFAVDADFLAALGGDARLFALRRRLGRLDLFDERLRLFEFEEFGELAEVVLAMAIAQGGKSLGELAQAPLGDSRLRRGDFGGGEMLRGRLEFEVRHLISGTLGETARPTRGRQPRGRGPRTRASHRVGDGG